MQTTLGELPGLEQPCGSLVLMELVILAGVWMAPLPLLGTSEEQSQLLLVTLREL